MCSFICLQKFLKSEKKLQHEHEMEIVAEVGQRRAHT
jgi:hypothetical protein